MASVEADFMEDRLRPSGNEQKLSRREFLGRARDAIAAAAIIATTHELQEGVSFNKPPLALRTKSIVRTGESIHLLSGHTSDSEASDGESLVTILRDGRLLFEPSGEFFDGTPRRYIHRANSTEVIRRTHAMGANLFDIDANDVNGTIYPEHGIVPQYTVRLGKMGLHLHLAMVIDVDEQEVKLGMPSESFEGLIALIGDLNTTENPLAASIELKRGDWKQSTLEGMFGTLKQKDVPAIIKPSDPHQFDFIRSQFIL